MLQHLQVTTRSPMGAMALHAEVALVDRGWVRVLGAGGGATTCSLAGLDGRATDRLTLEDGIVAGFDAVGGCFVLNGYGLPADPGEVVYLAPDALEWERTGRGYTNWLRFLFDGDLASFAAELRWPGWEDEVAAMAPDQALSLHPPPWSEEGASPADASRRPVPAELWTIALDTRAQLGL